MFKRTAILSLLASTANTTELNLPSSIGSRNSELTENFSKVITELNINQLNYKEKLILSEILKRENSEIEVISNLDLNEIERYIKVVPRDSISSGLNFRVGGWTGGN